jgi:hypothetical protein
LRLSSATSLRSASTITVSAATRFFQHIQTA